MSGILYTDHDEKVCAWLRELVTAGELPDGEVWCRDVATIKPDEVKRFHQRHWFCGIGGWPLALKWAGWPVDMPVDTASVPCQPFSCAGKRKGKDDERHLWPIMFNIIRELRPTVVFGEQVASADVVGKTGGRAAKAAGDVWLDGVFGDLEQAGYATGAAVLGAHSVSAPHRRQRLFWGASLVHADSERRREREPRRENAADVAKSGQAGRVADAEHDGGRADEPGREAQGRGADGRACGLADAMRDGRGARARGHMDNDSGQHSQCRDGDWKAGDGCCDTSRGSSQGECGHHAAARIDWFRFDILPCRDGKARRVESQFEPVVYGLFPIMDALRHAGLSEDQIGAAVSTFPLTEHAVGRMMLLKGYGNSISPQVAEVFVRAWMECRANNEG